MLTSMLYHLNIYHIYWLALTITEWNFNIILLTVFTMLVDSVNLLARLDERSDSLSWWCCGRVGCTTLLLIAVLMGPSTCLAQGGDRLLSWHVRMTKNIRGRGCSNQIKDNISIILLAIIGKQMWIL